MTLELEVQIALETPALPGEAEFRRWVEATLVAVGYDKDSEVVVRIVGEAESASLNQTYRHKQGATNVLSFPFEAPPGMESKLLGDVIICAPVVARETVVQDKHPSAHWAHLVIHGVLHLLGYEHQSDKQAEAMENLEVRILASLGYPDPYGDKTSS